MKPRTRARSLALQVLYEVDLANHPPGEIYKLRLEETPLTEELSEFARQIIFGILPLRETLDQIIAKELTSNARFDSLLADAGLFREEMDASRGERLETARDRMLEFTQAWNGQVKTMVTDGPPAETIDEAVRRRGADLVVVGSRGATATRMVLLGNVAEGLITQAPCDVLVARSPSDFRRP